MVCRPIVLLYTTKLTDINQAEDLPLNVSREMLQSRKFLKQIQSIIVKRLIQTLQRIHENPKDDNEAWQLHHIYNNIFKLGTVEDIKSREKLASLVKLPTNQRNETTLSDVSYRSRSWLS
jgi:heat shock protein 90kDa beta